MSTPNEYLMNHYGTRDVFMEKTANGSLLARLAQGFVGGEFTHEMQREDKEIRERQALEDALIQQALLDQMAQTNAALRHTDVPMPAGYDAGMVRLAMIATQAGADLAKVAGIGNFVSGVLPAIKSFGQKAGSLLTKAAPAAEKTIASAGKEAPGLLGQAKGKLLGPLGVKGNLALGGAALGAMYLGNKGLHAATGAMGRETTPPVYGSGALGYNPPKTVNDWGVPQN